MPSISETLKYILGIMPSYIVSTSYEQYIHSLCEVLEFPYENVYCTRLDIDKYVISEFEAEQLKRLKEEISRMPKIEIPKDAGSIHDLPLETRKVVERLDEIFWTEIPKMKCGEILKEVEPVGGYEKANAVRDITERNRIELEDVIYVGDSITDVDPFRLVRENGGLTVSFNGNEYAIREAEVAVISSNTFITSIIAYSFNRHGREGALNLIQEWPDSIKMLSGHPFHERILEEINKRRLTVEIITNENRAKLTKLSSDFRKKVRGEKIGKLG